MGDKIPFWFVWCEGGGAPSYKHPTEHEAWTEAERLARKEKGKTFVVLRSVGECVVNDVHRTVHDDIPF